MIHSFRVILTFPITGFLEPVAIRVNQPCKFSYRLFISGGEVAGKPKGKTDGFLKPSSPENWGTFLWDIGNKVFLVINLVRQMAQTEKTDSRAFPWRLLESLALFVTMCLESGI